MCFLPALLWTPPLETRWAQHVFSGSAQEPCSPADGPGGTVGKGPFPSGEKQDVAEHGGDSAPRLSPAVHSRNARMI